MADDRITKEEYLNKLQQERLDRERKLDNLQKRIDERIKRTGKEHHSQAASRLNLVEQIKDIENLVNEFSHFARMPRPVFKKIDLSKVVERSINFLKLSVELSSKRY